MKTDRRGFVFWLTTNPGGLPQLIAFSPGPSTVAGDWSLVSQIFDPSDSDWLWVDSACWVGCSERRSSGVGCSEERSL